MANNIKYNAGIDANALNIGNWSVGSDLGMGPTSASGFKKGLDIPTDGYAIYSGNIDARIANNDIELVEILNKLGANVPADDRYNALTWAKNNNVLVLNRALENIVTDGLVFNLDPRQVSSFYDNIPTVNHSSNVPPQQGGWSGHYVEIDTSQNKYEFVLTNYHENSAGWRSWLWDATPFIGQTVTISAQFDGVRSGYRSNTIMNWLMIGQTREDGASYLGYSRADQKYQKNDTTPERISWTGVIEGDAPRIGFTLWGNANGIPGSSLILDISNIQIEVQDQVTPYVYGTRNQSTAWHDLSGNNNHAYVNVQSELFNGKYFESRQGAPANLYMHVPHSASINNTLTQTSGGWMIEELVRVDEATYPEAAAGSAISGYAYRDDATGFDWNHGNRDGNSLTMGASNKDTSFNGSYDVRDNFAIDSSFGEWTLRTLYWDRDSNRIGAYINGQHAGDIDASILAGYPLYDGGGLTFGTLYGWHHDGARANTRLYNRILSNSEVLQNYINYPISTENLVFAVDAGNLVSYDKGSSTVYDLIKGDEGDVYGYTDADGVLTNGVVFEESNNGAWKFDGENDYISFGSSTLQYQYDDSFTLNIWINPGAVSGFKHLMGITWGSYRLAHSNSAISFRLDQNNIATSGGQLVVGQWTNITALWDGPTRTAKVYQDGKLVSQVTNASIDWVSQGTDFRLASSPGEDYYFNGKIAMASVYDKSLTDEEILQNYHATATRFK